MDANFMNKVFLYKNVVVFGVGHIGSLVIKYFKLCHRKIDVLTDNNSSLWGGKKSGLKVLSPNDVVKLFPEAIYIIANANHFEEIKEQLIDLGICDKQIIICDDLNGIRNCIYDKTGIKVIKENKYFIYDRPHYVTFKYVYEKIKSIILSIYYKIVMNIFRPKVEEKRYKVSICAIFQNEADYLKEWLEFHIIVGIEHFYLYNNFSNDNFKDILEPYIKKGLVDLIDWPFPQGQMMAYKDCVERYGDETKWIGFIDLDEFVVPNKYDQIYDFLAEFEKKRPIVIAYWRIFGTSGKIDRDINGLVTEDFTVAAYKYDNIGKLFFNTSYTYAPEIVPNGYMHYMWAKYKNIKLPPVNVFDKVCLYKFNPVSSGEMPIQINHYLLKSYSEYVDKKSKRGGGVHKVGMHNNAYFVFHERQCQKTDCHAYKYLIQLKLKVLRE